MGLIDLAIDGFHTLIRLWRISPSGVFFFLLSFLLFTIIGFASLLYLGLFIAAPIPRLSFPSEKVFKTITPKGHDDELKRLPCWQDKYLAQKAAAQRAGDFSDKAIEIEAPEVFVSLVVPAFNEEERLGLMLEEAVEYLQEQFGDGPSSEISVKGGSQVSKTGNGETRSTKGTADFTKPTSSNRGWEVLIVSDGSTDKTETIALDFARKHQLGRGSHSASNRIPHGAIRVISLAENRGKGGAVTHGMRHVRGKYAIFADADGASRFSDLGNLIQECQRIEDAEGRGVAVGSRAHLVGSEAVVKRSFLRNLLMHSFHLLLRILTPPATAAIRDTQCGFKLFSRPALPFIIPYMHSEGWIFDVEMLMLAESARIPVAEVPVGWKEVKGSKLNVLWDSLGMAWGLAVLRGAWGIGVYRRS